MRKEREAETRETWKEKRDPSLEPCQKSPQHLAGGDLNIAASFKVLNYHGASDADHESSSVR